MLNVKPDSYAKKIFASIIKNDELEPERKNKWILMDASIQTSAIIENEIILVYHPLITNETYKRNFIIRRFNIKSEIIKVGFFEESMHNLLFTNNNEDVITIENN